MKRDKESGSLAVGLAIFLSCALTVAWIIYATSRIGAQLDATAHRQAQALREASNQTQLLNRIALNNVLLLLNLERAIRSHVESSLAAVAHQNTIPFWKAKLSGRTLSEHVDLKVLLEAKSKEFSNHMRIAFALASDSATAMKQLRQLNPKWKNAIRSMSTSSTLCLVIDGLARKKSDAFLKSLKKFALRELQYDNCQIRLGGYSIFQAQNLISRLQEMGFSNQSALNLLVLADKAPLRQSWTEVVETWSWSPGQSWLSKPDQLRLPSMQVELIHPALSTNSSPLPGSAEGLRKADRHHRSELLPMLEPKWVPVLDIMGEKT